MVRARVEVRILFLHIKKRYQIMTKLTPPITASNQFAVPVNKKAATMQARKTRLSFMVG